MKTPFYIIKRTPANKETALAKWRAMASGDNSLHIVVEDLIDFCLSGGTEEKVFIEPGMLVRIKSMPAGAFDYNIPGVGAERELTEVNLYTRDTAFHIGSAGEYNCLRIKGTIWTFPNISNSSNVK